MKTMEICGIEISEGKSSKSGKDYAIGSVHALAPLAAPFGEGNVAKGVMGTTYECDTAILRKVQHLPFPIKANVEIEDVMRFGKRQQVITKIEPTNVVSKAA